MPRHEEDMNTGGRQEFDGNTRVCILDLGGQISPRLYSFVDKGAVVRADRKGLVSVHPEGDEGSSIDVHYRRVIPCEHDGKAVVIETGDKYRAVCPKCSKVHFIEPGDAALECCDSFPLHWLGVKPMTTTEKTTKTKKPTAAKKPKPVPEATQALDLAALAKNEHCELFTKSQVNFDHPNVDVKAHILLYKKGDTCRKLCFNTYNGTTGKKGKELPVHEFLHDRPIKGAKKEKTWHAVSDYDKEKTRLEKAGYELHT